MSREGDATIIDGAISDMLVPAAINSTNGWIDESLIELDPILDRNRSYWNEYFQQEENAATPVNGSNDLSPSSAASIPLSTHPTSDIGNKRVEWIASYDELLQSRAFHQTEYFTLKPTDRILIVGCGSSNLGEKIYDSGVHHVDSMDVSSVVIASQSTANSVRRPRMRWFLSSITNMRNFAEDGAYDVVIDKGTTDTLQFRCTSKRSYELVQLALSEYHRVLAPTGTLMCITPRKRMTQLYQTYFTWSVKRVNVFVKNTRHRRVHKEAEIESDGKSPEFEFVDGTNEGYSSNNSTVPAGAYAHICVKKPPTQTNPSVHPSLSPLSSSPSPSPSTSSSTPAYTHNIPKIVLEAQHLLTRLHAHLDRYQRWVHARPIPTVTTRSELAKKISAAHPTMQSPNIDRTGEVIHLKALITTKRTLSPTMNIYVVQIMDHYDNSDESTPSIDGPLAHSATSAATPSISVNVDKFQLFACCEDFRPVLTAAECEPNQSHHDDISSHSPSSSSSYIALHALPRKSDTIEVFGVIGRSRNGECILFIHDLQLVEVGCERMAALKQRANFHQFQHQTTTSKG